MNISFCIITFSAASSFYKSACDLIERALHGVQSPHDIYVLVHRVSPLFMGFSLLTIYVLFITVPILHGVLSAHCVSAAHPMSPAPTESTIGPPAAL